MSSPEYMEWPTSGLEIMKFTLTYDGELWSQQTSGAFEKKWEIREHLRPQLEELRRSHPTIKTMMRRVPKDAAIYQPWERHHTFVPDPSIPDPPLGPTEIDLGEPLTIAGVRFLPLVRSSYALTCSLNILFMRPQPPGEIYIKGDLDNRLKLFIDALRMPQPSEAAQVAPYAASSGEPINCLLQDDSLITGLSVNSTQLLLAGRPKLYARLIIEVDVRVTHPRLYNELFLGS